MLSKDKIDRINELAKKAKNSQLTQEEEQERAVLRSEYIEAVKDSLHHSIKHIHIKEENGEVNPIRKKDLN